MPTVRNIADIKSNLLHPALTSHFEVKIPTPPGLSGNNGEKYLSANGLPGFASGKQDQLNLMCSEATLPGSNLATFEINDNFHGVTERHGYRRIYDDRIDLTFYVDADNYIPIRYFETWIKYVVGESITESGGRPGSRSTNYFYRNNYPKDYMCEQGLEVIKFERTGKNDKYTGSKLTYEFVNAFPISVSSMPVSYDSSSLLKCSVSLSYIRYILVPQGPGNDPEHRDVGQSRSARSGDPSGPFSATPQQLANINNQAFNPNVNLSGVVPITTGGVPFDSAGAAQTIPFVAF